MMNLKLLGRLQSSGSASLILKANAGDILDYYLISRNISYDIVCSGQTAGTLASSMISFDIRMSSIIPLINKGYKFAIQYSDGVLKFVSDDEKTIIVPSYVESSDSGVVGALESYIGFSEALQNKLKVEEQIGELLQEVQGIKDSKKDAVLMELSGGPSSNPFEGCSVDKIDKRYDPVIVDKEKQIKSLSSSIDAIEDVDLGDLYNIASAASKAHTLIDMCGDYAVVSLKTSFLLEKVKCPIQSIQGQLLFNLIRDNKGKGFYTYKDELVYLSGNKEYSAVFIKKYLPNNAIDSTIITRGIVEEKYVIQLKNILSTVSLIRSCFDRFMLDMGNAQFILSNDLGETVHMKFEVQDAKTLALNKMLRGETVRGGITMATIDIPLDVQGLLDLFKDNLIVYVKKKKVIFQNNNLYLVFGR